MIYTIKNENLSAKFNSLGAELISLKKGENEYIWEADERFWNGHSPFLFPIVGGLRDNKAFIDGKSYSMPRHGFIRTMEFSCVSESENKVSFVAKANSETKKMYPFDFEFKVTYKLSDVKLETEIEVSNLGDGEMPFCVGAHPGISISENEYNDYIVSFDRKVTNSCMTVEADLGLVNTKKRVEFLKDEDNFKLSHKLFEIDAVIFDEDVPPAVTLKNEKNGRGVRVEYPDFPFLAFWSTPDPAEFVCIEPWTGYCTCVTESDDFRLKKGMTTLKNGEKKAFCYSIKIL